MAMLAEPRQRKRYNLVPRGKPLYDDDSRFGTKMLEKMGWSKGKGLGANEDGNHDFVRVQYKNDSQGLGFEDRDDHWTQHEQSFSALLDNLNGKPVVENEQPAHDKPGSDDETAPRIGFGFGEEKNKLKEKISGESLEEKSKRSRARVHYKKFTRGKDLAQYSEKDLANIFGRKENESPKLAHLSENVVEVEKKECSEDASHFAGVTTISTGLSLADYFKQKMETLKNRKNQSTDNESQTNGKRALEEENGVDELEMPKKKKKKSKEIVSENNDDEGYCNGTEATIEPSKKEKKKKPKDTDPVALNENLTNPSDEEVSKKKKKKSKDSSMEVVVLDNQEESVVEKSKKKKTKTKEAAEDDVVLILDEEDVVPAETANKKKNKKKNEETKGKVEEDKENKDEQSDSEELPKKKKRRSEATTEKEEVNANEEEVDQGQSDPQEKQKKKKKKSTERLETENKVEDEPKQSDPEEKPKRKNKKCKEPTEKSEEDENKKQLDREQSDTEDKPKKQKKKSKKDTENKVETFEDVQKADAEPQQSDLVDIDMEEKPKKKKKKCKQDSDDKEIVFEAPLVETPKNKGNDSNTAVEHTKATVPVPKKRGEHANKIDVSANDEIENDLDALVERHKSHNIYPITTLCAEMFRFTDIERFAGSNMSDIVGYALHDKLELQVQAAKADDEKVDKLWDAAINKYNVADTKARYHNYVKEVKLARKTGQKQKPRLNVKTFKRKQAFLGI